MNTEVLDGVMGRACLDGSWPAWALLLNMWAISDVCLLSGYVSRALTGFTPDLLILEDRLWGYRLNAHHSSLCLCFPLPIIILPLIPQTLSPSFCLPSRHFPSSSERQAPTTFQADVRSVCEYVRAWKTVRTFHQLQRQDSYLDAPTDFFSDLPWGHLTPRSATSCEHKTWQW